MPNTADKIELISNLFILIQQLTKEHKIIYDELQQSPTENGFLQIEEASATIIAVCQEIENLPTC